jgi:hypothetical protein
MSDATIHLSDPGETAEEALMIALMKARKAGQGLYVLVDASRSPFTQFIIETKTDHAVCLFDGQAFEDLSGYAPWLVPLDGEDGEAVFEWFMEEGWGNDWGLFLISDPDPKTVKAALKRSLRVRTEDDRELYFKFYRPSVFNNYMPAMDPAQSCFVMQDIAQVWAEDPEDSSLVRRYAVRDATLRRADLKLQVSEDA